MPSRQPAGGRRYVFMRNHFRRVLVYCLLALVAAWAHGQQAMPRVEGESLSGHKVVLPDDAKGRVAVLVFGFTKASRGPTSAWGDKIFADFGAQQGFALYQLPVLENAPRFIRGMIISGMKKGVRDNMRDHFIPVLKGESELKKLVGYRESDDAYLIVLDPSEKIVQHVHGAFSNAAYEPLRKEIQTLLHH